MKADERQKCLGSAGFVKVRSTDSILLTAPTRYGDQTLEAYSNIGRIYVVNALFNVVGSLEMKKIMFEVSCRLRFGNSLNDMRYTFWVIIHMHTEVFDSVNKLHYMITNVYSS